MTQEEKEILIKDLCARLPYGVKIYHIYSEKPVRFNSKHLNQIGVVKILPYLRPMSSMTKEERKEYDTTFAYYGDCPCYTIETFDFLNKKHFDFRGLIPMRLALEAPKDMYVFKNKLI